MPTGSRSPQHLPGNNVQQVRKTSATGFDFSLFAPNQSGTVSNGTAATSSQPDILDRDKGLSAPSCTVDSIRGMSNITADSESFEPSSPKCEDVSRKASSTTIEDHLPVKKKRGRKPLPDAAQRRKAQNRVAQKSFRARKLAQEKELQIKAARYDDLRDFAREQISSLAHANNDLRRILGKPEVDVEGLLSHPALSEDVLTPPLVSKDTETDGLSPPTLGDSSDPRHETLFSQTSLAASITDQKPQIRHSISFPINSSGDLLRPTSLPATTAQEGVVRPNALSHAQSAPEPRWSPYMTSSGSENVGSTSAEVLPTTSPWASFNPTSSLHDPFMPMVNTTPQPLFGFSSEASGNPFDTLFHPDSANSSAMPPSGQTQGDRLPN